MTDTPGPSPAVEKTTTGTRTGTGRGSLSSAVVSAGRSPGSVGGSARSRWGTVGRMARAIWREVVWWVGGAARVWWRYPIRVTLILAGLVYDVLTDHLAVAAAIVVVVLGLVLWARLGPVSFRRWVGLPMWRRRTRRRVRRGWRLICESVGLARRTPASLRTNPFNGDLVPVRERVQHPRLARVKWRDGQLVVTPVLLTGQTVDDVDQAADRLRVAVGATRVRVYPNSALTGCQLVFGFGDALAQPFDATVPEPTVTQWSPTAVQLGRTEDGREWWLPPGLSTLTAGSSGSGKASLIWGLVFALAPAVKAGVVRLYGVDLKGGMELTMGRPLFTRYASTAAEAVQLLEDTATELQARASRLAGVTRQHEPTIDEPLTVLVVDELAALIAYLPDRDLLRRAEAALSVILSQGRAVGFTVFAFLQDPRKETVRMRHLFTQAIALRLRDREEVAMVLGEGAVNAGALCHKIPPSTPGVGYVIGEDNRPMQVRAGYVSDQMIQTAAQRFPAPVQVPIVIPEPIAEGPRPRARTPRASSSSSRSSSSRSSSGARADA